MADHAHPQSHAHVHGRVTPLPIYFAVFATLMVLTALTVIVAYFNFGAWNKVIALSIAGFKATIVVLYFMHVKYASKLTKLFANPKLDIEWVYAGDELHIVQTRPLVGH